MNSMPPSSVQLSAMLSVLLMAISLFLCTHIVTQILRQGWMMPSWIKISKEGGVAIRMPWCTFFNKKLVRGYLFWTREYDQLIPTKMWPNFELFVRHKNSLQKQDFISKATNLVNPTVHIFYKKQAREASAWMFLNILSNTALSVS